MEGDERKDVNVGLALWRFPLSVYTTLVSTCFCFFFDFLTISVGTMVIPGHSFRKVEAPRFPGSLRNKPQHQHSYQPYQQPHRQSDRPLPASYVCYRCGQKGSAASLSSAPSYSTSCRFFSSLGHWIQDCPTNNDREWDNKPRIKRTTGIPRSFLKTVEQPTDGSLAQGVMVTPEGGYVIAQPDTYAAHLLLDIPLIILSSVLLGRSSAIVQKC